MLQSIVLIWASLFGQTPGDPNSLRIQTSNELRESLAAASSHSGTGGENIQRLVDIGTRTAAQLGEGHFSSSLQRFIRDARWMALTDSQAAQQWLGDKLNQAASDLAFEPTIEAETPLGFPDLTPVREVQLKAYPAYRMARVDQSSKRGSSAFWKLFGHIRKHDISMTAPVEMTYSEDSKKRMGFLYGSPDIGSLGEDGRVEVVDVAESWAVSMGCRGWSTDKVVEEARQEIEEWLKDRPDLVVSGPLRVMSYNSPMVRGDSRYFEVQLPVMIAAQDSPATLLVDFGDEGALETWYAVNDVVMGGRSSSEVVRSAAGFCAFEGRLSLENNGGFASVRSPVASAGWDKVEKLSLTFRGDGKQYKLRLRTDDGFDGANHEVKFSTAMGVWTTKEFRLEDFRAVWRGRTVKNAPKLRFEDVRQVGLMISDKQAGSFRLEVSRLEGSPSEDSRDASVRDVSARL